MNTVNGTNVSLGTTLYSYTNEWVARRYTLEQLVAEVADAGIGPGVEIVGFQSVRTFPHVDPGFVRSWRSLLDRYGLEGSCLGSNIDVALRKDRWLTDDEMVDYLGLQIDVAKALGFPTVRIQMGATLPVIERAAVLAERAGVTLGMEIHAPESAVTPDVLRVRELYDRLQSEHLGFIPDFSSTMRSIPPGFTGVLRGMGVPGQAIDALAATWAKDGAPFDRYHAWAEFARSQGAPDEAVGKAQLAFTMFGHENISSWAEIMPQTVHVHGKFYGVIDGAEPSIDYLTAMKVLVDGGYRGYVSSEWEGHAFAEVGDVDVSSVIQEHHALETSALEKAALPELNR